MRSAAPRWNGEGTLLEHMNDAERIFNHEDIAGTIVALFCPKFMGDINFPGWHMHFISEDRSVGGRILDLALAKGFVTIDQTRCFNMVLPDNDLKYALLDLSKDQSEDIKQIEGK